MTRMPFPAKAPRLPFFSTVAVDSRCGERDRGVTVLARPPGEQGGERVAKRLRDTLPLSDSVGLYLDSVSEHELLTAEDEVRLARAMEQGRIAQRTLDEGGRLSAR